MWKLIGRPSCLVYNDDNCPLKCNFLRLNQNVVIVKVEVNYGNEIVEYRLFTVPCRNLAFRAAILDECQIYLGDGYGLGGREKDIFLLAPPTAIKRDPHPLGTWKTKMAVCTGERSILRASEKTGDCQ